MIKISRTLIDGLDIVREDCSVVFEQRKINDMFYDYDGDTIYISYDSNTWGYDAQ